MLSSVTIAILALGIALQESVILGYLSGQENAAGAGVSAAGERW